MKRIILILTIISFLLANAAWAGGFKEIMLGAGFGAAFGVLVGGTTLAFDINPDPETPKTLLLSGGIGLVCGAVFGIFVPAGEEETRAVFNLDTRSNVFSISPLAALPTLSFARSVSDLNLHAGLLKLDF